LLFPEEEGSSDDGSDLAPEELRASEKHQKKLLKKTPLHLRSLFINI